MKRNECNVCHMDKNETIGRYGMKCGLCAHEWMPSASTIKNTIYMGYDHREKLAYEVAKYSIMKRAKNPENIEIIPLTLDSVKGILDRPIETRINENGQEQLWCPISDAPMTTEFAISRFSVPFLQKDGWALFMDCDMVCLADIEELFALADDNYAVMCVKHKHEPTEKYHDAGRLQTFYKRKNWSSVVLWNLNHEANKKFTINDLNTLPGRDLHAFFWLEDDQIGELPLTWNFLVGVNEGELREQKMLHYTNGSPAWGADWEPRLTDCIFNDEAERMRYDNPGTETIPVNGTMAFLNTVN